MKPSVICEFGADCDAPRESKAGKADAYDSAKFYDCHEDGETLTHTSEEDALQQQIDDAAERDEPEIDTVRRVCPMTVYAFDPDPIDPAWANRMADRLLDEIGEAWVDDGYGNPDGDDDTIGGKSADAALCSDIRRALKDFAEHAVVWSCSKVGEREYDAEQVARMLDVKVEP